MNGFLTSSERLRHASTMVIILLIIGLLALIYSFVSLQRSFESLDTANVNRVTSYRLAQELRQSSDDLTRMARSYVITGNPEYKRQYYAVLDIRAGRMPRPQDYGDIYWDLVDPSNPKKPRGDGTAIPLLEMMKKAGFSQAEFAKLKEAETQSNTLAQKEIQAFNLMKGLYPDEKGEYTKIGAIDTETAKNLMFDAQYASAKARIMKPINEFFGLMNNRVNQAVEDAQKHVVFNEILFGGLVLAALILIGILVWLGRQLAKLELEEKTRAQQLAEDENEKLNNSVVGILESVFQLSQRDLTVKAPVTEDVIGTVSDSINMLTTETSRVLLDVTDVASQVKESSQKVRNQSELVTQTAEEERKSVVNMYKTLVETTQTMNRVAGLAEDSNNAATQATIATNDALSTVNTTVQGMESIRETIAETEKRIKRLGERSQEISGIVNLINTIAERTHVLALNASMQAAVAGDAGRGFAVVAEEVQRLAESSRNATQQISSLVSNIQLETNETINTVNNTISQVVEGSTQAQKAGEQMRETQAITEHLVAQVQAIAAASEAQKTMSFELLQAVKQIGASTKQTANQIEAQNNETLSLQKAAEKLVASVSVFKLPNLA